MKIVNSRTDGLVLAFRVRLSELFHEELKRSAKLALRHRRVAFRYDVRVPDTKDGTGGVIRAEPRLGPVRARWTGEYFEQSKLVGKIWGEMADCRTRGIYRITNDPFFTIEVKEYGDGAGEERHKCSRCDGLGLTTIEDAATYVHDALPTERCKKCLGSGTIGDPGWNIEITTRAQELARVGLDRAWREAEAIASLCGEVLESRLRRIDLCADVAGWQINPDDLHRLAKRPQARVSTCDNGERPNAQNDNEWMPQLKCGPKCRPHCVCDAGTIHEVGGMNRRRVTGISVGRTGNFMARIYDKRVELDLDRTSGGAEKRENEERRWKARGWDGEEPVTRVEFQLRGVVLAELGIRNPDACEVPVSRSEAYRDRSGKARIRRVVLGRRVVLAREEPDDFEGPPLPVIATITHRQDAVWRTCLDWIRLVEPRASRTGKPISVSRLSDDPRWKLLRTVKFGRVESEPIRRCRPRQSASYAQALGVMLSQAGRDGAIRRVLPEDRVSGGYYDDSRTRSVLLGRVLALAVTTARNIVEGMIEEFGGAAGAAEHYAIRQNASHARFERGRDLALCARPPPEESLVTKVA